MLITVASRAAKKGFREKDQQIEEGAEVKQKEHQAFKRFPSSKQPISESGEHFPCIRTYEKRFFQEAAGSVKSRFDGKCFAVLEKFLIHC